MKKRWPHFNGGLTLSFVFLQGSAFRPNRIVGETFFLPFLFFLFFTAASSVKELCFRFRFWVCMLLLLDLFAFFPHSNSITICMCWTFLIFKWCTDVLTFFFLFAGCTCVTSLHDVLFPLFLFRAHLSSVVHCLPPILDSSIPFFFFFFFSRQAGSFLSFLPSLYLLIICVL